MKRKPFRTSENIIRIVTWNFENGAIKNQKIRYIEASKEKQ
jgi:hypothetical protein